MEARRNSTMLSWVSDLRAELSLSRQEVAIFAAKALRVFAYSFISIVLPVYLLELGYPVLVVGVISSLAIGSAAAYNLVASRYADIFGRRKLLVILALLTAVSGVMFATGSGIAAFVLAAIVGPISATGTETGPFMNVETAALTKFCSDSNRTITFSAYNFVGYIALSLGALFSGLPSLLSDSIGSLRVMLYAYAAIMLVLALIYHRLGNSLELEAKNRGAKRLSAEARGRILHLAALFSLDAFGGGFVVQTILTAWFYSVWHLNLGSLALVFFISGAITAASIFMAAKVAKRIGLLNTMVFTHAPSSLFLIAIPFAPSAIAAVVLLFLRQSISQMDVPARQSYTMAIVRPEERVAAGSLTNTPRAVAQAVGPSIASYMLQFAATTLPFVVGGTMKITYDALVFLRFRHVKPPEEVRDSRGAAKKI